MKIQAVRARVFEWKGKTVPPQGNFCANTMDLVYDNHANAYAVGHDAMNPFRFDCWTVVIACDAPGHPLAALHPEVRRRLIVVAQHLDPLVLRWGR